MHLLKVTFFSLLFIGEPFTIVKQMKCIHLRHVRWWLLPIYIYIMSSNVLNVYATHGSEYVATLLIIQEVPN